MSQLLLQLIVNIDNDHSDEDDNSGSKSSSDEEDVILAFIDDDEEVAFIDDEEVERPATTPSGRAITRRSEIDFSFFFFDSSKNSKFIAS